MNLTIASTAIRQDDAGRYCLNDLHRAAGGEPKHTPGRYTGTQQFTDLVDELSRNRDNWVPSVSAPGLGTFACKELVYAYAMWISPRFHIEVIRAYDAMASVQARRRTHGALVVRAFSELGTFTARHMHLGARQAYRMGLRAMAEKYGQDIVDSVDFDFEALPDLPVPRQRTQGLPRPSARPRAARLMERLASILRAPRELPMPLTSNPKATRAMIESGYVPRQVLVKTMHCSAAELDALVTEAKSTGLLAQRSGVELGYMGTLYTLAERVA